MAERYRKTIKDIHRKKQPNIYSSVNELAWEHELNRERAEVRKIVTPQQIKYYKHLCKLARDNGLEHLIYNGKFKNRSDASQAIKILSYKLYKRGIDTSNPYKRKFKFDAKGNIVDIKTGKIVRKRI